MAPPSQRPASDHPAAPWALLWLGAIAAAAWVPLFMADREPRGWLRANATVPLLPTPPTERANPLLPPVPTADISWLGTLPARESPDRHDRAPGSHALQYPQPRAWVANTANTEPASQPHAPEPLFTQPIRGALLLGGPLGLESLQEKAMVPAARLEQSLRARAADRLAAVPPLWRPAMRALLQGSDQVLPAEVVRLPAPHLKTPEEYPLVMNADGIAETTVTPPHRSKEALERWARKVNLPPRGSAQPLLLVLEPLQTEGPSSDSSAAPPLPQRETSNNPE